MTVLAGVALALAAAAQSPPTAGDSATLCVRERYGRANVDARAIDRAGASHPLPLPCNRLPAGAYVIRRLGNAPASVVLTAGREATVVELADALTSTQRLAVVPVTATRGQGTLGSERESARTSASLRTDDARRLGIGTVNGVVAALPFTSQRVARGETGLSLRGARGEQTAATLDGMPLNDPATGTADLSDIPLVALGAATVTLGADPLGAGSGAIGGVLGLHTAARRALSARFGAFGSRLLEGAWHSPVGGRTAYGAASWRSADNDFAFENAAGAGAPVQEQRVNNDERRLALVAGTSGERMQSLLLLSSGERGMVGPANVRTYDADRARTDRLLLRARGTLGALGVAGGARALRLAYRDPTRPVLDFSAGAFAGDVEVNRSYVLRRVLGSLTWRAGVGGDRITATGGVEQARGRAFVAAGMSGTAASTEFSIGARADGVGDGAGVLPSLSLGAERRVVGSPGADGGASGWLAARVAQAVRVPTLYDLYFASPQRLTVRTLRPERVLFDGELAARGEHRGSGARPVVVDARVSLVARETRDAIVWFPGNFTWSPDNVGRERLRGAEARMGLATGPVSLSAWATGYQSTLLVNGLRVPTPYVARAAGGGQGAVTLRGATLSAVARVTGPRPYTAGPRNAAFELPAVVLVDLALSRSQSIGRSTLLASVSIDNATDVAWQSVRGFPSPGRGWAVSLTLTPGSTR